MPADPPASVDASDSPASGADGRVLRSRGHRTRTRLLEAGAQVFAAKGLHATRVDDVVKAARSSHGTFYLYFSSKEDLFDELVAQVSGEIQALVDTLPSVTNTDKSRAALREWLGEVADLYERSGPIISAWTEAELSGQRTGDHGNDALGALAGGLLAKVRVPKRAGLDPTVAMLAMVTMVERLNYYATTRQVKATRDELLDTLMGVIDAAVFG